MYTALLYAHSYTRWLVVAAALVALGVAWHGWLGGRAYGPGAARSSRVFQRLLDLQILLGLVLYAVSPLVRTTWGDLGSAMGVRELRFFGIEHITGMILAAVLAQVGAARVRRAESDGLKLRRAAIWQAVVVLLIAASIPWWRPLLRS